MKTKSPIRPLSLPPNTQDVSYGKLKLEIGQVFSLAYGSTNYPQGLSNYLLQFHICFFGESEATVLRAANTERALLYPNVATYDVRTNVHNMMTYLEDMQALSITIYDTALKQSIGVINIPLKLYLNRNLRQTDRVHTFIEFDEKFPIVKASNAKEKIGEIQIHMEGTASFEKPGPDTAFLMMDQRLPNSAVTQGNSKPYTDGKYKANVDYMQTVQEMKNKLSSAKQRAASTNRGRTMARPQMPPPAMPYSDRSKTEEVREDDSVSSQKELDEILERGKKLKGKMEQSLATGTAQEVFNGNEKVWTVLHGESQEKAWMHTNMNALDFEVNEVTDSLSDFEKYKQEPAKPIAIEEPKENVRSENFVPPTQSAQAKNVKEIKKMIVNIMGISFKSEEMRKKLLGRKIYIQTKIPIAEYGSAKVHEEETKVHLMLDKHADTGIVELNRIHECGIFISDDNFGSLVNSKFSIELLAELENENIFQLFGRGELNFQKVILATGYKIDTLVRISYVAPQETHEKSATIAQKKAAATKKGSTMAGTKGKMQIAKSQLKKIEPISHVADLRLIVELSGDLSRERTLGFTSKANLVGEEEVSRATMIGLLLCIKIGKTKDIILRKYENEQTQIFRNLYVKYKSFPAGESMSTTIAWGTSSPFFGHVMQYPLFLNSEIINKLNYGIIVFELWDKHAPQGTASTMANDELLGIVKIPLKTFHASLKSQVSPGMYTAHHILANAYPFILADDLLPVINLRLGQSVGFLGVTVAIGTPAQIQRLEIRDKEKEIGDKSQKYAVFADVRPESERNAPNAAETMPAKPRDENMPAEEVKEIPNAPKDQVVSSKEQSKLASPEPAEKNEEKVDQPEKQVQEQDQPENPTQAEPEHHEEKVKEDDKDEEKLREDERLREEERVKQQEIEKEQERIREIEIERQKQEEIEREREREKERAKEEEKKVESAKPAEKAEGEVRTSIEEINEIAMLLNPTKQGKEEKKHEDNEDIVKIQENPNAMESATKTSPMVQTVSPPQPSELTRSKFLKHRFMIEVTELANIPVLSRFAVISQKRALNLYLRANLPFDRTPVESESILQTDQHTYKVAMECSYSILLPSSEDSTQKLTQGLQQDILIELCALDSKAHNPVIVGTAELPIEDMQLLITNKMEKTKNSVERVVFIYGTAAADREGLIIGKVKLQLKYEVEPSKDEGEEFSEGTGHLWQQERVVNREIPVNCRMMIYVNKIDGIDEARTGRANRTLTGMTLPTSDKLNLSVHYNPIGELINIDPKDLEQAKADNDYSTQVVFCSGEPKFKTKWYIDFTVDQQVLNYLEHENANFEIRHNAPNFSADDTFGMTKSAKSDSSSAVVGTARVPLIRLLSTHSGVINEAVEIKDRYNHCFGYLHLSMNLLDASEELKPEVEAAETMTRKTMTKKDAYMHPFEDKKDSGTMSREAHTEKIMVQEGTIKEIKPSPQKYPIAELEITIESGLRLKNPIDNNLPPNAFAVVRYSVLPEEITTNTTYRSSSPAWNTTQIVSFALSPENLEKLQNEKLYVYVYHKETIKDKETDLLIGVCVVDTTILGMIDIMNVIEGYYKIYKSDKETTESKQEMGILKIKILPLKNIKKMLEGEDVDTVQKAMSPCFAREDEKFGDEGVNLQSVYETLKHIRGDEPQRDENNEEAEVLRDEILLRKEEEKEVDNEKFREYDDKLKRITEQISGEESEVLVQRHMQNMQELDKINKMLKDQYNDENEMSIRVKCDNCKTTVVDQNYTLERVPSPTKTIEAIPQYIHQHMEEAKVEPEEHVIHESKEQNEPNEAKEIKEEKNEGYELEIRDDIHNADETLHLKEPIEEIKEKPKGKEAKKVMQVSNVFEKNMYNIEYKQKPLAKPAPAPVPEYNPSKHFESPGPQEAQENIEPQALPENVVEASAKVDETVQQSTINRKKLLTTPHKKPPLPQHLSSSIKKMTGNDLKEKELERITKIMRASPSKGSKKFYDYSSDSDS